MKYNGSSIHKRAILHMIGQAAEVFRAKPSVAEIAAWMSVSKTTALRHLKKMESREEIIMSKTPWRPQVFKWQIELHPNTLEQYRMNILERDYRFYANRVLGIKND